MYSSASPRSARDTIREFEQVRGFFLQALGGPPAKPAPVRLVAFGSAKEYEPYRINEFAIAYYHQTVDRDYIVMSHGGADTFPVAVHEYVHLLVRHSGLKLPPWLNEGLAELYSTLRPLGGKILVGDLIPNRHRALLEDKWVPLATIIAADQSSPYYNEKNKAGSLYNEGWALTHMLRFRAEYRPKFDEFVRSISAGEESAPALFKVYGRSVEQVEKDLRDYLRGSTFQGSLVTAKLEKSDAGIPMEPLLEFDTQLMFADLMYRPGKEALSKAAFERLAQADPQRPEPYRGLAYLAWRAGRRDEAVQQFGRAFEGGDRDPRMLWDYGRLAAVGRGEEAIRALSLLLSQESDRMDVRLELADAQLRANQAKAALETLRPVRKLAPADAARYFRIVVGAQLRNGDRKGANETAAHFRDIAQTDEDRTLAVQLLAMAAGRDVKVDTAAAPVEIADGPRPHLRRAEPTAESPGPAPEQRRQQEPLSVSGRFIDLDCRGNAARMTIETAAGRKVFLIEEAGKVAIVAGSNGPVDMSCGPQKAPVTVQIGYDQPSANQAVDGVVRTIAFQPGPL